MFFVQVTQAFMVAVSPLFNIQVLLNYLFDYKTLKLIINIFPSTSPRNSFIKQEARSAIATQFVDIIHSN